MYFQDTLLLTGQAATKARMNQLHVDGNDFQLSGSNMQRGEQEIPNKFNTSILQTFTKLCFKPSPKHFMISMIAKLRLCGF